MKKFSTFYAQLEENNQQIFEPYSIVGSYVVSGNDEDNQSFVVISEQDDMCEIYNLDSDQVELHQIDEIESLLEALMQDGYDVSGDNHRTRFGTNVDPHLTHVQGLKARKKLEMSSRRPYINSRDFGKIPVSSKLASVGSAVGMASGMAATGLATGGAGAATPFGVAAALAGHKFGSEIGQKAAEAYATFKAKKKANITLNRASYDLEKVLDKFHKDYGKKLADMHLQAFKDKKTELFTKHAKELDHLKHKNDATDGDTSDYDRKRWDLEDQAQAHADKTHDDFVDNSISHTPEYKAHQNALIASRKH